MTRTARSPETKPSHSAEQVLQPIDALYESAARNADAVAIAGPAGSVMRYAELVATISALACAFQQLDPRPGSRVGICAGNTTEHLLALLATYAAGKVWVPLSPRNARGSLDAMIAATSPSLIVTDAASRDKFTHTAAHLIDGGIAELAATFAGKTPARIERGDGDPQIIKFSGGSTGQPKPVVQSLRCVSAQARGIREFFAFDSGDVNLIAAPLTHGASCFVLPILEVGGSHVLLEAAKPASIFGAVAAHGVTTLYAPPTMLYAMIESPEAATTYISSLRHVIYSAAPMPPQRIRDCQRVLGPVIETAYGQVEAPQIIAAMRADELMVEDNLLSVGRASSVATIGIMDPDGALLRAGEVGEIVVSGPLLMSGYLDRPEETASTIVEGWLHTGDLGELDDRGYLFIRGRLRELINTGGFKVFPAEVEASLSRHPAVAECAVFGAPDERWGEAVNAAVVLASAATVDDLIAWVKSELGSVKAPKHVWLVESLPRNAAGKVSRGDVRASLSGE